MNENDQDWLLSKRLIVATLDQQKEDIKSLFARYDMLMNRPDLQQLKQDVVKLNQLAAVVGIVASVLTVAVTILAQHFWR